jgi:hypothetical protein
MAHSPRSPPVSPRRPPTSPPHRFSEFVDRTGGERRTVLIQQLDAEGGSERSPAVGASDGDWAELTPRGQWRTMSNRVEQASEILGRTMNTHDAAMKYPYGPKQYMRDTSSDEEDVEELEGGGNVYVPVLEGGGNVVMTDDPSMTESLVTLSRSSSSNVLYSPRRAPAPAPSEEQDAPMTEQEELEELERENAQLQAAIAAALAEETERKIRHSERSAFKSIERVYAAAELQPEPEPEQVAVAAGGDGAAAATEEDLDEKAHLLSLLQAREQAMQEQEQEIRRLREQLAAATVSSGSDKGSSTKRRTATGDDGADAEYRVNVSGMSSAYDSGAAPGGSMSELKESGSTFKVKTAPPPPAAPAAAAAAAAPAAPAAPAGGKAVAASRTKPRRALRPEKDGEFLGKPAADGEWKCSVCTKSNPIATSKCSVCGRVAPKVNLDEVAVTEVKKMRARATTIDTSWQQQQQQQQQAPASPAPEPAAKPVQQAQGLQEVDEESTATATEPRSATPPRRGGATRTPPRGD